MWEDGQHRTSGDARASVRSERNSDSVAALSRIPTFALQPSDPDAESRQMHRRATIDLSILMERSSSTALLKFLS